MMKSFFKASVATVVSAVMVIGMSSCGRSESGADSDSDAVKTINSSKATGDLTIWAMGNEGDLLDDFVKGFEKENPDVKIKVTAIPWSSAHDKLQTAIAAGNGPDLAQMGTTWMADFSNSFSTVPDNLDMSDFSDGSRATGQVDGKQLGVPWYIDTRVLYYRTDIAGMAGWNKAPKTWNELKRMAKDMQKVDGVKYGMSLNSSGTDAFLGTLPFSYSAGASLTNEEQTKWTFDDNGIKKGLNFTTSLYRDGIVDVNADVSSGADIANFVSGSTPMMLQGPTAVSQINELGGDGFESKYATVILPSMNESSGPATSFVGGCNLVTFKDSKNKQSAWKFIQWASKPEVQAEWYKKSSDLPASQKA
ncbi:extracellular solute-binding protein [Bifidobacterium pseudocatenulatum]|nr:extracellular solute-binding protein [Bifidobacterium pseudocatenulatum]